MSGKSICQWNQTGQWMPTDHYFERLERSSRTRRGYLAGVVGVALAGCAGADTDQSVPYRHLDSEPLYLGSSFDIKLPAFVTQVDDIEKATLAVLSGDTAVGGDQVVKWLRDGTPVAVAGRPAEANLSSLLATGDYRDYFDSNLDPTGEEEYLVAAVAPSEGGDWLATLLADSDFDDPVARSLDDVLSGIVAE